MSLVRNPDNIDIWANCEVFVGKTAVPTVPADIDTPFDSSWLNLGVLNGDSGVANPREWDRSEHFGWNVGRYRVGFKNYKESISVTALERNLATRRLAMPGSTASTLVVPVPSKAKIALQRTNDFGEVERLFTRTLAQVTPPSMDFNESDPASRMFMIDLSADGTGVIWDRQYTAVNEEQELTVAGVAGTYTIDTGDWGVTSSLAYNANAGAIQAALVALLGSGNVTVTGTGPFDIAVAGDLLGLRIPLFVASGTGGTTATIVAA